MAILFTFGANDRGQAEVCPDANGQMNIHVNGHTNVIGYLELGPVQSLPYLIYGGNPKTGFPPASRDPVSA
jgi:hypothetical protein